ncbi:MAG: hypothetical protein ABEJ81_07740 [Haloferacaceae archaeon]
MDEDSAGTVREWHSRSVEGLAGLGHLAGQGFSGVVEPERGAMRAYVTNGKVVGVTGGELDDLDGATLTAYAAPDDAIPLLFAMQERGGDPRARYYTEETPLSEVNRTLEEGGFTGYVELSENVLSGDYYVVYHGGRSSSVAFVGASRRLLTGEEAFERAADEVGIYDVVDVDVSVTDLPDGATVEDDAGGAVGGGIAADAAGDDVDEAGPEPPSDAGRSDDESPSSSPSSPASSAAATSPSSSAGDDDDDGTSTGGRSTAEPGAGSSPSGPYSTGEEIRVGAGLGLDADESDDDPEVEEVGDDRDDERGGEPAAAVDEPDETARDPPDATPTTPVEEEETEPATDEPATDEPATDEPATGGLSIGEPETDEPATDESETGASLDPGATGASTGTPEEVSGGEGSTDTDDATGEPSVESTTETPESTAEPPGTASADAEPDEPPTVDGADADGARGDGTRETTDAGETRSADADGDGGSPRTATPVRDRVEAELREARAELDRVRAERDDYRDEAERLRERIGTLESRIATLEQSEDGGEDPAAGAERSLSPAEALSDTNLFVRYGSKAEPTLETIHGGDVDPEDVNRNLRIERHTRFETERVVVDGEPFESFLTSSFEYRFVEWVVRELPYELRSTGSRTGMERLYDAVPEIDRIQFGGSVRIGDGSGDDDAREFDVVFRDRMGGALAVADLHESRDPTGGAAVTTLVEDARTVALEEETLGSAFVVTKSYYEPPALEAASGATGGGFLSRSRHKSYVKMDRKRGFHLCLVEARDGEFNLRIPDL